MLMVVVLAGVLMDALRRLLVGGLLLMAVLVGLLVGLLMCCSCVCVLRTSKGCVMRAASTPTGEGKRE